MSAILFVAGWFVGAATIVGIHVITRRSGLPPATAWQLRRQRADLRAMRARQAPGASR